MSLVVLLCNIAMLFFITMILSNKQLLFCNFLLVISVRNILLFFSRRDILSCYLSPFKCCGFFFADMRAWQAKIGDKPPIPPPHSAK